MNKQTKFENVEPLINRNKQTSQNIIEALLDMLEKHHSHQTPPNKALHNMNNDQQTQENEEKENQVMIQTQTKTKQIIKNKIHLT